MCQHGDAVPLIHFQFYTSCFDDYMTYPNKIPILPPKTNLEPENRPLGKFRFHIGKHEFLGSMLVFGGGTSPSLTASLDFTWFPVTLPLSSLWPSGSASATSNDGVVGRHQQRTRNHHKPWSQCGMKVWSTSLGSPKILQNRS